MNKNYLVAAHKKGEFSKVSIFMRAFKLEDLSVQEFGRIYFYVFPFYL